MVLALVVLVHLLFLAVASWGRRPEPPGPEPEAMILLDLTPPPVEVPKTPPQPASRNLARTNTKQVPQPQRTEESPAAITPEPPQSPIDWRLEAHITAEAQAKGGIQKQRQECEEARQHGKYPPGCPRDSYDPHWEPEDKKAGLIGGFIPYVRLGKRCIVALGFFACNPDPELPKARGDLLNDMTDPSRPASSIPELDNAAPEAPKPQALKPQ